MFKEGLGKNKQTVTRVAFFVGFLLFCLLIFGLTKELVNRRQIDRQLRDYQQRIDKLRSENSSLSEKINSWEKSGELEASARVKLGLEKPGEKTSIIARSSSADDNLAIKSNQDVVDLSPMTDASQYESNASKWWKYFFSN